MRRSLLDRLTMQHMAREACFLLGQEPDEMVAGFIVDAAGQRHWCRRARWRWYADRVSDTSGLVVAQDNGGRA